MPPGPGALFDTANRDEGALAELILEDLVMAARGRLAFGAAGSRVLCDEDMSAITHDRINAELKRESRGGMSHTESIRSHVDKSLVVEWRVGNVDGCRVKGVRACEQQRRDRRETIAKS